MLAILVGREKRTPCWSNCKKMGQHSSKLLIKEQDKNKLQFPQRHRNKKRPGLWWIHASLSNWSIRETRFSAWNIHPLGILEGSSSSSWIIQQIITLCQSSRLLMRIQLCSRCLASHPWHSLLRTQRLPNADSCDFCLWLWLSQTDSGKTAPLCLWAGQAGRIRLLTLPRSSS